MKKISEIKSAKARKSFSDYIYDYNEIVFSDYEYSDDNLRIFVYFSPSVCDLQISSIDIYDDEYKDIECKSCYELKDFFKKVVEDYNDYRENNINIDDEIDHRKSIMFNSYY